MFKYGSLLSNENSAINGNWCQFVSVRVSCFAVSRNWLTRLRCSFRDLNGATFLPSREVRFLQFRWYQLSMHIIGQLPVAALPHVGAAPSLNWVWVVWVWVVWVWVELSCLSWVVWVHARSQLSLSLLLGSWVWVCWIEFEFEFTEPWSYGRVVDLCVCVCLPEPSRRGLVGEALAVQCGGRSWGSVFSDVSFWWLGLYKWSNIHQYCVGLMLSYIWKS